VGACTSATGCTAAICDDFRRAFAGSLIAGAAPAVHPSVRILLVDDEPLVLSGIRRVLVNQGHDVVIASSALDALEVLEADAEFDVVFSDLMLPDLEGAELYARAIEANPGLEPRFLFMTGGALTPRARAFITAFKARCIDKPFDARTVCERVRSFGAALPTRRVRRVSVPGG
jgi:CheY-like chemotaxis protein